MWKKVTINLQIFLDLENSPANTYFLSFFRWIWKFSFYFFYLKLKMLRWEEKFNFVKFSRKRFDFAESF